MIKDGGPAYPAKGKEWSGEYYNDPSYGQKKFKDVEYTGMSLRDWFAGMALQGYLANPSVNADDLWSRSKEAASESHYQWADAMIKARGQS